MRLLRYAWSLLEVVSLGFCISDTVNQAIIFYLAYYRPSRSIMVRVDMFGEGSVEAVLYPVSIVIAVIAWGRLAWKRSERRR